MRHAIGNGNRGGVYIGVPVKAVSITGADMDAAVRALLADAPPARPPADPPAGPPADPPIDPAKKGSPWLLLLLLAAGGTMLNN